MGTALRARGLAARAEDSAARLSPSIERWSRSGLRIVRRIPISESVFAQSGRPEEAERAFRQALTIDPRFARSYTNLGALALLTGDAARARDYYLQALAVDDDNVLARMQLASLLPDTFHDYHAAARMCGEARLLAPATPGVVECVERNQRLAQGR